MIERLGHREFTALDDAGWHRLDGGSTAPRTGREGAMYLSGKERSEPAMTTRCLAARFETHEDAEGLLRHLDECTSPREIAAQCDAVARALECACGQLADVMAEQADAVRAGAEASAERELGVPSLALGAVQARLDRIRARVAALQLEVASLHALHDHLADRLAALAPAPADAYRKAG